MLQITTQRTTTPKAKPDESSLGFGVHYTDHMLIIDHDEEQGWHDARIVPYQPLELDPAAMVFHYAMESFEGLKAYRTPDGSIQLFRPDKNAQRMINTNHRMCLPSLPVEDFVQAVKAIVSFDQDWVPHAEGTSTSVRLSSLPSRIWAFAPPAPTSSSSYALRSVHTTPPASIRLRSSSRMSTPVPARAAPASPSAAATTLHP